MSAKRSQYQARESWLAKAMAAMVPLFKQHGFAIPANVRVSCGLPSVKAFGTKARRIGECWASQSSRDKHFEIFISPTIDAADVVLATLVHEVVHATVGLKAGHRGEFVRCAKAVGLVSPWTSTSAGETLAPWLEKLAGKLGKYPHGSLDKMTTLRKKQPTRLVKVECGCCGYKARITMTWLMIGVPSCPNPECDRFEESMEVSA